MKLIFEAAFDMGDLAGGLEIAVVETGGASFSVDVPSGEFFPVTDGATLTDLYAADVSLIGSLLDEIVSQLNAGTGGGGVWAGAFDDTTERFTFALLVPGTVTAVSFTPITNGGLVGLTGAISSAIPFAATGQRAPDYVIAAAMGFWSETSGEYEGGDDVAYDSEAHDGTPGGAAKDDAPVYLDFEVPSEPVERTGNIPHLVDALTPWTWKSLWTHCRNVTPFIMRDDTGLALGLLHRAEGARFQPRALGDNYIARWDIRFQTRVIARS